MKFDTQSSTTSNTSPSTEKQKKLAEYLVNELHELGLNNAYMDNYGYVYAYLEGTSPKNKTIGLISHMDTSPDASGENITPNIIESYSGSVIKLNDNISLDPSEFPSLKEKLGHTLITTNGNTLLGADDKAGICIIVSTVERIIKNKLPHPNLIITFTPDEEIGEGTKNFNYQYYKEHNCNFAYTIDGGDINYISYENFNAASCEITVNGKSIHPGDAKNKMVNSIQVAMEFNALLPVNQRPEYTEGYEGFYHLSNIEGGVENTKLSYIIRNHNKELFEKQKALVLEIANFLNSKYGYKVIDVNLTDSYYNMKELVQKEPKILEFATKALKENGLEPKFEAIRGGTDGARLSYEGILTPNLGTGGENFYGTDKIAAEKALLERVKDAYILRPPYLYGPMNNVYREAFVFDCALADRKFYLPKDGDMKLQFFHVKDLCRLMEVIIKEKPEEHILNVGNAEAVSIKEWVTKCYESLGKKPTFVNVYEEIEQRNYFSFYNYEYYLDVSRQGEIFSETTTLEDGLKDAAEWYLEHNTEVNKKPYFEFIDENLVES